MRMRSVVPGFLVLLLVLWSSAALAAKPEITYEILDREGYREVEVKTPLADYILSEQGGVLKSILLTFVPYGSSPAELVPGATSNVKTLGRQYLADAIFPFTLSAVDAVDGAYQLVGPSVDAETGVFRAEFNGKLGEMTVRKTYTIRPDALYTVEFSLSITNRGRPVDLQMTVANYIPRTKDKNPLEIYYLFDGEPGQLELAKGSFTSFDGVGLMSSTVVFFLSPKDARAATPFLTRMPAGSDHFGIALSAGAGTTTFDGTLYGGRRRFLLMKAADLQALDTPGVGARLMIPVIQFLELLYHATGNYGLAIILFTILVRVILWPLMQKQMHSMAKLQQLSPKMKQIQERFKDDKQAMQERMMELYRKEKINPMSGCLPMVIQLPIIYLIWRAILLAGEQIHLSPGFLWVPDLSLHDPYFVLIILTTAVMLLQQWLMTPQTGTESSPGAKWMGYIFPVVMAVLLWKFPAGLWLYYLLTTAAQVGQQALVNRQMKRSARLASAAGTSSDVGDGDGGTWTR